MIDLPRPASLPQHHGDLQTFDERYNGIGIDIGRMLVHKNSSFVNNSNSFDKSSNKDMKPYMQDAVGSAIISSTSLDSNFAPLQMTLQAPPMKMKAKTKSRQRMSETMMNHTQQPS